MHNKPLLSICIPTYNRSGHLKSLIESIINQKDFSNDIEICIYDDPSSDDTETMIVQYTEKYSNIHYHRNTVRAGMTAAFLYSILKCSGKYVWLFGSDDIIGPFGISSILSIIKNENPDLILSNYGEASKIDYHHNKLDYLMYDNISAFCNNFQKQTMRKSDIASIDHYISYFSYISIYCFRNDLFRSSYDIAIKKGQESYLLGHYFNWAYALFGNTNVKNICLCNNPILTYNKSGGASGRKFSFKIIKDVKSMFDLISRRHYITKKTKILFRHILLIWFGWYIGSKVSKFYLFSVLKRKYNPFYTRLFNIYTRFLRSIR